MENTDFCVNVMRSCFLCVGAYTRGTVSGLVVVHAGDASAAVRVAGQRIPLRLSFGQTSCMAGKHKFRNFYAAPPRIVCLQDNCGQNGFDIRNMAHACGSAMHKYSRRMAGITLFRTTPHTPSTRHYKQIKSPALGVWSGLSRAN